MYSLIKLDEDFKHARHSAVIRVVSELTAQSYKTTHSVIGVYLATQKSLLLSGADIHFGSLVTIKISSGRYNQTRYSTASLAYAISKRLSIPYNTTLDIIRTYLSVVSHCLEIGYPVTFQSIVKLKPRVSDDKLESVGGNISNTLSDLLNANGISARVSLLNWRRSLSTRTNQNNIESISFKNFKSLLGMEETSEENEVSNNEYMSLF